MDTEKMKQDLGGGRAKHSVRTVLYRTELSEDAHHRESWRR